jgi:regulator of protease activity HflC (stomatin/prohibitin superfamily)
MQIKLIRNIIIAAAIILAVVILNPVKIIGPTERGVKTTLGQVDETTILQPGVTFRVPFVQKVIKYDMTPNTMDINIPLGGDGAVSSDKQTLGVKGSVNWKYDENKIITLATTYKIESRLKEQVERIIITAVKNMIGKHAIGDIIKDQTLIASEAKQLAITELSQKYPVVVETLNLSNWDWSEDYDKMIRDTVAMSQAAEKAKQELLMVEQTSQKQIKEAEAKAKAIAAEAQGRLEAAQKDAEARRVEGQGIADYNRLIAQNMQIEIQLKELEIRKIRAEKFNGVEVAPVYVVPATGQMVKLGN